MTKVKMLKTTKGAVDFRTIQTFYEGQEYQVSDSLLECFIDDGVVELVDNKKAVKKAPENKAIQKIPSKKGRKKNAD